MAKQTYDPSNDLVNIAKEFLRMVSSELDPHTKEKGQVVVEGDDTVILLTPSHIQFAKYGRGPGKKPPLDPILKWVKEKHIQFRSPNGRFITSKGTAFAIQRSIGKNGTKNWVKGAPNALEEAVTKNIDEFNKKLGDMLAVEIGKQISREEAIVFPVRREFKF